MSDPREWMRLAVDLAKQSRSEERADAAPLVGAVIVRDGKLLAGAFRGETGSGDHAEFGLLEKKLAGVDVAGADVFTTLEPCSRRTHPKSPCAERLVQARVRSVWIGMYDPNPRIYREGWRILRDAGIELHDFDPDFRAEIAADNVMFLDSFRTAIAETGTASLDHSSSSGEFPIEAAGETFVTKWSPAGGDSIWAYRDRVDALAHARYATDFDQVDDPAALNFSSRAHLVRVGEIAVFRRGDSYLLVQVMEFHPGPTHGGDRTELRIRWQGRAPIKDVASGPG